MPWTVEVINCFFFVCFLLPLINTFFDFHLYYIYIGHILWQTDTAIDLCSVLKQQPSAARCSFKLSQFVCIWQSRFCASWEVVVPSKWFWSKWGWPEWWTNFLRPCIFFLFSLLYSSWVVLKHEGSEWAKRRPLLAKWKAPTSGFLPAASVCSR